MAYIKHPFKLRLPERIRTRFHQPFHSYNADCEKERGFPAYGPYIEIPGGRERVRSYISTVQPRRFRHIWTEVAFIYSICMSQVLVNYFILGFNLILPSIQQDMGEKDSTDIWPITALPLAMSLSLFNFHRISNKIGGRLCYIFGTVWLAGWSLAAGLAQSFWFLSFTRAMCGIGIAAFLAPGRALIDETYPAGRRKSVICGIYNLASVVGLAIGLIAGGFISASPTLNSAWYHWIGGLLALSTTITSTATIQSDYKEKSRHHQNVSFDWLGTLYLVPGLFFTLFAVTHGANAPAGWTTTYIPFFTIVGVTMIAIGVHVEGWYASHPLLPPFILRVRHMKAILSVLLLSSGQHALYITYATRYFQLVMGASSTQLVAWYSPILVATAAALALRRFLLRSTPAVVLLAVSQLGSVIAALLLILCPAPTDAVPRGYLYWAMIFPGVVLVGFSHTTTTGVASRFITSSLSDEQHSLATTLFNAAKYLGMALFLAVAGNVQGAIHGSSASGRVAAYSPELLDRSLTGVFWLALAVGCAAFLLSGACVKMGKLNGCERYGRWWSGSCRRSWAT